ncbi:MAG: YeeE/YedE family protein [Verrucomicrobia bacterium]|nr:YeeE/YedE family protein [Verrucomicrobiota bacterium]
MFSYLKKKQWSPYAAGVYIGLLAVSAVAVFHKTIGTSTTFVKLAALFWAFVDPDHLLNTIYYHEYLKNKAWFDWQFLLVIGIFLGANLSRRLSRNQSPIQHQEASPLSSKRSLQAFIGGIIVIFGARLAGGCTSGHAISGGFQLALSGWLFMLGVFAVGIPTALVLYRKKKAT